MEHSAAVAIPIITQEQEPQVQKHSPCHNEHLDLDLSLQIKSKEDVYTPKEWVTSKLQQVKTASSLSENTTVIPESVRVAGNKMTMQIKTGHNHVSTMELDFFENGIFKLYCVNPVNPSKFSFELIDKPANLTPYDLTGKVVLEHDRAEVSFVELQAKVVVRYNVFAVSLVSNRNGADETLFEMNTHKSLRFDENLTADFSFSTEYLYGIPERACDLLLEDTKATHPYRFYNQDLPTYPLNSKGSLYATVPILIARQKNSPTLVTMYWQNTSDTYIEIHKNGPASQSYWFSERGNLECYVFVSHTNAAHYKALANLFGHCAMPQYFSLGYHQCRWSYKSQEDLLQVNAKFNEHEIPCDTLTLDIDHTDGCRYFTWNDETFPDPVGMQKVLVNDGRQLITIADPHIKVDEDYYVYKEAIENNLYVKTKNGNVYVGHCWPGKSIYLDFLNEETRKCWASQYRYDKYLESTPNLWAWNDMNEPSVFEMPGNHMPIDNLQTFKTLAEPEKAFQVEHREVHNIYGYCHHKATYEGMIDRDESKNIRPFVLTRSFYAGSQKYTTVWTGDTGATWGYLKTTIPQLLTLALCGISNAGGDVGGFMGNPEPELAIRWYQLGTFMPFFRAHSETTTKRREPWLYQKKYLDLIRESVRERYKLLPYWYTLFDDHCRNDMPILRPIWFDQDVVPEEANMKEQERFIVGDGLLVVPIVERGQVSIKGALQGLKGRWYDYFTKKEMVGDEEIKTGLERIGCFVKGGQIIPTFEVKSYAKSSKDVKEGNIHLIVGLDDEDKAKGKIYFDDGETFNYKKGIFARKNMEFNGNVLTWQAEGEEGLAPENRVTKAFILGSDTKFESAFLVEEGKNKLKIQMTKTQDYILLEFVILAHKNWKIVLE